MHVYDIIIHYFLAIISTIFLLVILNKRERDGDRKTERERETNG